MFGARSLIDFIADIWREARRLMLVLWLCRVSTASALLALGLSFLPQVQDLYTEITYYKSPTLAEHINTINFWLYFYVLSFLWAFTVHYCARTVLSFETWPLSRKDEAAYGYWIEAVPRYLGWVCIIAIFIGQINALQNLQIDDDLLNKTTTATYAMPLFIVLLLIMALQTARRKLGKSAIMISGLAIFYWLLTASDIYFKTRLSEAYQFQVLHNLALPVVTILWGVIFYYFVAERRPLLKWLAKTFQTPHHIMLRITRQAAEYFPVQIRPMHNQQTRDNAPKFLPFQKHGLFRFEAPSDNVRGLMLGLFTLTFIMVLWLLFAIEDPGSPPFGLKRALLLPVLLGIWVPLLSTITFLSNQIRFPFLTLFIIVGICLTWTLGDNHNIKTTTPIKLTSSSSQGKKLTKLDLSKALNLWMERHNCKVSPKNCPTPLIIAASGGASRSAFFVATVLGELLDKPELFWPKQMPAKLRPKTASDVNDHIFAISSVSGGSLGSAVYAALRRGASTNIYSGLPCNANVLRRDKLLFSVPEDKAAQSTFTSNWKNCLQAITAGDFLSPAMVSFTFRDNLAFSSLIGKLTGTDRAKALEDAWVNREQALTGYSHLNDPLLSFQPTTKKWMPLLLLNATSVTTGKRLIATPLKTTYSHNNKSTPLFTDSLDLHSLLNFEKLTQKGWQQNSQSQHHIPDIALSKAVSLSARFPLISPHGNILSLNGSLIDRVVDGGYFDNSGMLTALELAKAIETLTDGAIKPMLVQISNHPVSLDAQSLMGQKNQATSSENFSCPEHSFHNQTPRPTKNQLLSELTSVSNALLNARVARGSHAIARAFREVGGRFVHFQVAGIKDEVGANKKLSMSWWLSKSVQHALDNQINWQREQQPGAPLSIKQRLNPAFCAIQKFRLAQRNHWKNYHQRIKRHGNPYRAFGVMPDKSQSLRFRQTP